MKTLNALLKTATAILISSILLSSTFARTIIPDEEMDLTKLGPKNKANLFLPIPADQFPKSLAGKEFTDEGLSSVNAQYTPDYLNPLHAEIHHRMVMSLTGDNAQASEDMMGSLAVAPTSTETDVLLLIDQHQFLRNLQDEERPFTIFGEILLDLFERLGVSFDLEIQGVTISGESFFRVADADGNIISAIPLADGAQRISLENICFGDCDATIGSVYITEFWHRSTLTVRARP